MTPKWVSCNEGVYTHGGVNKLKSKDLLWVVVEDGQITSHEVLQAKVEGHIRAVGETGGLEKIIAHLNRIGLDE